jgi:hypothetical protein
MNSPTPASGGDTRFSSDFLSHDGFPSILWEVLNSVGYPTPPLYTVQLYEEHRVPRWRVWLIGGSSPSAGLAFSWLRDGWIQDGRHHWSGGHEDSNNFLWLPSPGYGNCHTRLQRGRAGCIAYVCQDLFPHICWRHKCNISKEQCIKA